MILFQFQQIRILITMNKSDFQKSNSDWFGETIAPGESRNVHLAVGESYSSMTVEIQIHIRRALKDGPVVFVTAALPGGELNGCRTVRQLIKDDEFELLKGTLVLIPILNLPAFEQHSRYLPDHRLV